MTFDLIICYYFLCCDDDILPVYLNLDHMVAENLIL
jgi:hypothetical protein